MSVLTRTMGRKERDGRGFTDRGRSRRVAVGILREDVSNIGFLVTLTGFRELDSTSARMPW